MSEAQKVPEALQDLIDDYLSDLLEESRLRQLEARLCASAEDRQYFVRYCRLHTDLHMQARARQAGERALRTIEQFAAEHQTPNTKHQTPNTKHQRRLSSLPTRIVPAAAVFLLALGSTWWLTRGRDDAAPAGAPVQEVAWLVNAQNCQWADNAAPTGTMRAGTVLRVERGLAEICFRSGARVVLEGPASLELLSANSARMLRGKLTARVPRQATGFEIRSPGGKVVDLGTEFGLSVAENGRTDVYVFEGKVEASPATIPPAQPSGLSITENQAARMDGSGITLRPDAREDARRFVRAIVPPPVIVPRQWTLDFRRAVAGTIADRAGVGTGLTQRLRGTGSYLPNRDPNLRLDPDRGQLELTTTNSDINTQFRLHRGEYLGVRLSDLGFTGTEDFAVTATIPNIPALEVVGQFGLYAGASSARNIRGGLISSRRGEPGQYSQFLVNNRDGSDADIYQVGLLSTGTDLRLTLKRVRGEYALTVENLTTGSASTLTIRHPDFLDGERDLFVGLFGANTQSQVRKTLVIKELAVTVWTVAPIAGRTE
jgi:hypothetical protein